MPEHDKLNKYIANLLKVDYRSYSTDEDAAWELISDATLLDIGGYWYCKIEGVEWEGRTQETKALAICDAILRSHGIPWSIFE